MRQTSKQANGWCLLPGKEAQRYRRSFSKNCYRPSSFVHAGVSARVCFRSRRMAKDRSCTGRAEGLSHPLQRGLFPGIEAFGDGMPGAKLSLVRVSALSGDAWKRGTRKIAQSSNMYLGQAHRTVADFTIERNSWPLEQRPTIRPDVNYRMPGEVRIRARGNITPSGRPNCGEAIPIKIHPRYARC